MAAYVIADTHVTDQATYEEYKRKAVPIIARFGGKYLARGGPHEVLEGDWTPARLVIIEFPTMEAARSWYASVEYAPLRALRQPAARLSLVAVEGC